MKVVKVYMTKQAAKLVNNDKDYQQAYQEVIASIGVMNWPKDSKIFTINNTKRIGNGVVPIKDECYIMLEFKYNWYREKPLDVLEIEKEKGGPIDVYKEFGDGGVLKRVGVEFETGNISSGHRSMNKLLLGLNRKELDLAIIMCPIFKLAYFLTDRITNFEELEPYFENAEGKPYIFIGFDADAYDSYVPYIPKGNDGMAKQYKEKMKSRNKRKWKDRDNL